MHARSPRGLNTMDAVFHHRTLFGAVSQRICRMEKQIRRRLAPRHILGTENLAFKPRQQPCLPQSPPDLAVGPAGCNTMRQPQAVEGLFDSVNSMQMQIKRPPIPILISIVPTGRQGDFQVFFNLGDEVSFGFSNEAADYFVKPEIPPKVGQDTLVHPDSNGLRIHQDAVAIKDHQFER